MRNNLRIFGCILAIFIFALPSSTFAQQIENLPTNASSKPDKAFFREQWFRNAREDEQGSMKSYLHARRQVHAHSNQSKSRSSEFTTQWYPLGPSKTTAPVLAQLGLVSAIWVDTTDYLTLYAGSNTGGLFKTTDGGENWHCLTDTVFTTGVLSIHVDPRNLDRILIGTGHYSFARSYGVGMLESLDGGLSWHETGLNTQTVPGNFIVQESGMQPDNPDNMLALVNGEYRFKGKIYRSTDGASSWQQTYNKSGAEFFCVEYTPGNPETVYASGNILLKSKDSGVTWSDLTHHLTLDTNYRPTRIEVSVSPIAPDSILVFCEAEDSTYVKGNRKLLFLSTDGAESFKQIYLKGDPFCSYWKMQLSYSPTRHDEFYLGGMWLYKYRIEGDSGHFIGNSLHTYHKDVRDLKIFPHQGKDRLYMGNDGGVTLSEDGTVTYRDITRNGMQILQLYKITADDNSDNIFGGPQDGNISFYNTKTGEWWKNPRIGDAYDGMINYNNPREVYIVSFPPNINEPNTFLMKSINGGANFSYLTIPDSTGLGRLDKPVAMDPVDPQTIYVGLKQVWKSADGGQTFERISNFTSGQDLVALKVSPSNPQIICAAFGNPYWSDASQPKLMITPDGGNRWFDITPRGQFDLQYTGIADFTFHPDSSRKIWLALNRQWKNHQVYVTDDAGTTWKSYSDGLPVLPVNAIRYIKGADSQLLIAGTDVGVFYREGNMDAWAPFGEGLPLTIVSDLEVNYKRRKVIAATFGRGLWEADLCLPVSEIPEIVQENTTWTENRNMLHDLVIAPGAALTIKANVEMGQGRTIKVMPGASLTLEGGKLLANCTSLWEGIRLYGHADYSDNSLTQGILTLKNGATIENANIAVQCISITDSLESCAGGGGIIYASQAYFRNNRRAVVMQSSAGINPSIFKFCRFTTNALVDGQSPEVLVELNGVQGVTFVNCQFENLISTTSLPFNQRGTGIKSFNSSFIIRKFHQNDSVPFGTSTDPAFKQLTHGIDARFSHPGFTLALDGVRFDRNLTGALISGAGFVNISNSKFKMLPGGLPDAAKPLSAGIYLDHCLMYNINLNDFSGTTGGVSSNMPSAAIVINECGTENNLIAGNTTSNTTIAVIAQNQNRSVDGSIGLRFLNNRFVGNVIDLAITSDSTSNNIGIGLRQGAPAGEGISTAGNQFSHAKFRRDGDIRNQGPVINYYFNKDTINHQEPRLFARIAPIAVDVPSPGDSAYIPEWLRYGDALPDKVKDLDNLDESMKLKMHRLIDGGNTSELLLRVTNHQGHDSPELYSKLLEYSPYLSDGVLKALSGNNYFPNKMLMEVLLKNCHFIRLPDVITNINERNPEIPGWMKHNFLACFKQYSALDHLTAQGEMTSALRDGIYNLLSGYLLLNTPVEDVNNALSANLSQQNTTAAQLLLAFTNLNSADSALTLQNLSAIPENDDFSATDKAGWSNLVEINRLIFENGQLCSSIDINTLLRAMPSTQVDTFASARKREAEFQTSNMVSNIISLATSGLSIERQTNAKTRLDNSWNSASNEVSHLSATRNNNSRAASSSIRRKLVIGCRKPELSSSKRQIF